MFFIKQVRKKLIITGESVIFTHAAKISFQLHTLRGELGINQNKKLLKDFIIEPFTCCKVNVSTLADYELASSSLQNM